MSNKLRLLASSTVAMCLLSGVAHAADTSTTIEELVVTAEKREQSLQDVPVAISAFTSEKRDLVGINTVADMTNFTPGLQYSSQLDRTSLRGVGRLTNVHAADGAVAIYLDGIYNTSTILGAAETPLFVDRVEVLRGPQGTLYGRNSIGGAINTISRRPTEDWYAEVRGSYSNYNHSVLEGAVSGPTMIPGVQFRLAGGWEKQTKGWIDNIVPGQPDEGNVIDQIIVEGQLKFHFNDNFEGWVKLAVLNWKNGAGGPGSRATWTPFPYPNYEYANAALALNPGYGCNANTSNVVNASPTGCVNPALTDPRKIASTVPYKVGLNATYEFASEWIYHFDTVDLKYVLGGTRYHYYLDGPTPVDQTAPITSYTLPGGLVVNPRYAFNYQEDEEWWSHELNLSSSSDSPLQWLAGAYYYREGYNQPVYTTQPDQTAVAGPFRLPTTFCARTNNVCAPNPLQRIYDNRPHLDIESAAAFGQIDWKFADTWKATLGLRYSHDKKYGYEDVRVLCYAVAGCLAAPELNPVFPNGVVDLTQTPSVVSAPAAGTPLPAGVSTYTSYDPATGFAHRGYKDTWAATTGTAGLQWDPDNDTMVYGRYSRGYKAGGFRIGIDTVLGASPETDAEHVDAFEFGIKKNFANLQTNLALFRYNYKDAQVPLTISQTSGGLGQANSIFYNIPKAISQGVELETIWQPIEHLQVLFNYSYLDAHVTESMGTIDAADPAALDPQARPIGTLAGCTATVYGDAATTCAADIYTSPRPVRNAAGVITATSLTPNANGGYQRGQNLDGQKMPNAPKNKIAVNVNYTLVTSNTGSFTGSISYLWRDQQYGSIFNRSYNLSPSWSQWDARITWKAPGDRFTMIAYGKNIFDHLGYEGGPVSTRRAGVVDNNPLLGQITNNLVQGVASSYPLTPPRTFGVELQYKFF
jgi:iron complex outermembrane receptor protein